VREKVVAVGVRRGSAGVERFVGGGAGGGERERERERRKERSGVRRIID
jgi:hypothetical protein